jgi:hypothetical protein
VPVLGQTILTKLAHVVSIGLLLDQLSLLTGPLLLPDVARMRTRELLHDIIVVFVRAVAVTAE